MLQYPLTEATKKIAQYLAVAWDNGTIDQFFHVMDATTLGTNGIKLMGGIGIKTNEMEIPPIGNLLELSVYGLIQITPITSTYERGGLKRTSQQTERWEILLLQELRNAVANDFVVSEYFLTVSAVGTIIDTSGGNLTISAPFQSSAALSGDIVQIQTAYNVANELRTLLGEDLLGQYPELRHAIEDVETADETHLREKLGGLLATLANLVTVGAGIPMVSRAIEFVGKVIGLI